MQSLQNFNEFAKTIDFLLYEPYSTVVSPYLFIDIIHIFHRKHEVFFFFFFFYFIFYESKFFYNWNIYKSSPMSQNR